MPIHLRPITILFMLVALTALPAAAQEQAPVDTAGWLRDFDQLKDAMASHYANLEWAVAARRMDLPAISAQTERALRSAASDAAARAALQAFLAAFGDGHLEIRFPARGNTPAQIPAERAASVCARGGYIQRAPRTYIPFERLADFRRIDSDDARYFPLGILQLTNGQSIGVLRIASFEDNVFIDLCERAALKLSIAADSNCVDGCSAALERETSNLVTDALTRQIKLAQAQTISALVVDITHNGGGTNWVEAAARVFTPVGLRSPRKAFVRHPHHVRQLADNAAALRRDIRSAPASARPFITFAITKLEHAKREAEQQCDRRPLWEGKQIACTGVVTEPALFATGVVDYARPGELSQLANCCALFYPARYRFQEGVYAGKLFVLIDRETVSAAEYFAALLKDNGAASLIGEATYGAGCGYTNGGIPTTLTYSGARVRMPDCVRYRADGSNEVDGIIPDTHVPWRVNDSPYQRARKTLRIIETELTR